MGFFLPESLIDICDSYPPISSYNILHIWAVLPMSKIMKLNIDRNSGSQGKANQSASQIRELIEQKWPEAKFRTTDDIKPFMGNKIAAFNTLLPGCGIPRGQIIEITGNASSGKTSLVYKLLSGLTSRSRVVYIDLSGSFFPAAAVAHGVDIDRLIVVKSPDSPTGLRTAELLLQQNRAECIVIDLADEKTDLPMILLHRLRMQTIRSGAVIILLTEDNSNIIPSSSVSLRLLVSRKNESTVTITVTKSRISKEGLQTELALYE